MKEANYAPIYCALYPELAKVAREHGYALAVHGSLGRDMDLFCIPWIEKPCAPADLVRAYTERFALRVIGEPDFTWHGRQRWMISVGFGECAIDLQFLPCQHEEPQH